MEVDKQSNDQAANTQIKPAGRIKRLNHYLHKNPKQLLAVLIILVLVVGGLTAWATVAYKHNADSVAISQEREQYRRAENTITKLTAKVQDLTGAPADRAQNNYCKYASSFSEIGKGDLSCSASIDLIYAVKTQDEARRLASKINVQVRGDSVKLSSPDIESALHPPVSLGEDNFNDKYSGLDCFLAYTYYLDNDNIVGSGYPVFKALPSQHGLIVDVNCGKRPVRQAYYQVY